MSLESWHDVIVAANAITRDRDEPTQAKITNIYRERDRMEHSVTVPIVTSQTTASLISMNQVDSGHEAVVVTLVVAGLF